MHALNTLNTTPTILSLDGPWDAGLDRLYDRTLTVPGLATDPTQITTSVLWYRRTITLPPGTWTHATLLLYGARFCPTVYINGDLVSCSAGGMTVTTHPLTSAAIYPDNTIQIEIALQPLSAVDPHDASYIPRADQWRTNISSCLWDHVSLHLHGSTRISRIIPTFEPDHDQLSISWHLEHQQPLYNSPPGNHPAVPTQALTLIFQVLSPQGQILATSITTSTETHSTTLLDLAHNCSLWSPEQPALYTLRARLLDGTNIIDEQQITLGLKTFRTSAHGFLLNAEPIHLRAGTVVWHRWLRDPEASVLAFDTDWFEQHILLRLKHHGANALRFHLGTPPEALLDLCDRHGLLVQIEWHFFHAMTASFSSLCEQWQAWLDLCLRHPSICLIHPWNETEGSQLVTALEALNTLASAYPPLVISHRDLLHVHKYWWSLFENLGLYYDSAEQFPLPIMVDEFGGNYLDGDGNPGGYPTLAESFLRFLGPDHDAQSRLQLQTLATARVAEYWRRLGAAGFSPFCILGSPEDGSHYFLGPLQQANPKPVWTALTAAYSPLSCSLEIWDRNLTPGQSLTVPLYLFNETPHPTLLIVDITITPTEHNQQILSQHTVRCQVPAHHTEHCSVTLQLPQTLGTWHLQARLQNPPATVTYPVISSWQTRTLTPFVPILVQQSLIGIPDAEDELRAFCAELNLQTCSIHDPAAQLCVTSARSWDILTQDHTLKKQLAHLLQRGQPVLMLDVGPQKLGYAYLPGAKDEFLQAAPRVPEPEITELNLLFGQIIRFSELPEPESCLHPTPTTTTPNLLWDHLDKEATWLWNGLRGGLIVPAIEMSLHNYTPASFLTAWQTRGADIEQIQHSSDYHAYELAGFYAFSQGKDEQIIQQLRDRVTFLIADAPSLAITLNPAEPIHMHNLSTIYHHYQQQKLFPSTLTPLARCGKQLTHTAVFQLDFVPTFGRLILSQLITRGRLAHGFGTPDLYGLRYDPAAVQLTLNMLHQCLQPST